jgi:intracellular sulfur oxidation DsrE/DsrF family protein
VSHRRVNRDVTIRQLYEWPNLNNPTIYNNINNGLNSFQFSYDLPADQVQVVVQASASANLAMYADAVWAAYRLGEVFKIQDPSTGQPAMHNPWFASKNPPVEQPPADRTIPYYSDISIEGLQRRGVLFLICHQTIHAHAGQIAASEQNVDQQTAADIAAEIQKHLVPGALLVPSAVGELVRIQDKGFRLVVNA